MRIHVKIPHGCYVVEVLYPAVWRSIKFGFLMRSIPFSEQPYHPKMTGTHPILSEADLLLIASTNPENHVGLHEIHDLLKISL
jgi:hypothetical protein